MKPSAIRKNLRPLLAPAYLLIGCLGSIKADFKQVVCF